MTGSSTFFFGHLLRVLRLLLVVVATATASSSSPDRPSSSWAVLPKPLHNNQVVHQSLASSASFVSSSQESTTREDSETPNQISQRRSKKRSWWSFSDDDDNDDQKDEPKGGNATTQEANGETDRDDDDDDDDYDTEKDEEPWQSASRRPDPRTSVGPVIFKDRLSAKDQTNSPKARTTTTTTTENALPATIVEKPHDNTGTNKPVSEPGSSSAVDAVEALYEVPVFNKISGGPLSHDITADDNEEDDNDDEEDINVQSGDEEEDEINGKRFDEYESKPLQTLQRLQQMLDDTDYMTSKAGSRVVGASPTSKAPLATPHSSDAQPASQSARPVTTQSLENSVAPEPETPGKLWTSKDRAKYKKQQQKLQKQKQEAEQRRKLKAKETRPEKTRFASPPIHVSSDHENSDDTDDGLGYALPNLPVYYSDNEGDWEDEPETYSPHQFSATLLKQSSATVASTVPQSPPPPPPPPQPRSPINAYTQTPSQAYYSHQSYQLPPEAYMDPQQQVLSRPLAAPDSYVPPPQPPPLQQPNEPFSYHPPNAYPYSYPQFGPYPSYQQPYTGLYNSWSPYAVRPYSATANPLRHPPLSAHSQSSASTDAEEGSHTRLAVRASSVPSVFVPPDVTGAIVTSEKVMTRAPFGRQRKLHLTKYMCLVLPFSHNLSLRQALTLTLMPSKRLVLCWSLFLWCAMQASPPERYL